VKISVELLRKLIRYDAASGELYWLPRTAELIGTGRNGAEIEAIRFNTKYADKLALNYIGNSGYKCGAVLGKFASAARVAWALTYGEWPPKFVDHINGNRADNRIENLRSVTAAENARNAKIYKTNSSGVVGVYWFDDRKKWGVSIRVNKKLKQLGFFSDIDEAANIRKLAQVKYGFHENHGRKA
jgi:HNH endonuclease